MGVKLTNEWRREATITLEALIELLVEKVGGYDPLDSDRATVAIKIGPHDNTLTIVEGPTGEIHVNGARQGWRRTPWVTVKMTQRTESAYPPDEEPGADDAQ